MQKSVRRLSGEFEKKKTAKQRGVSK